MNKSSDDLFESLLAIAAVVGLVIAAFWLLKQLFSNSDSSPDLQLAVWEKDRQIEQLTGENKQLASLNAELTEENAYLRKLLYWWSLAKDFCARLAARLLAECVKMLVGLALKFATA